MIYKRWTTGMVVAMPSEAYAIFGRRGWKDSGRFRMLFCDGFAVIISGTGSLNSFEAAGYLLDQGAEMLVSTGVAGGLDPALEPGDVVCADYVMNLDAMSTEIIKAGGHDVEGWPFGHNLTSGVTEGSVITVSAPLCSAMEKDSLYRRTGAVAVDMECFGVAKAASDKEIPFCCVKSICDDAACSLPEQIVTCMGDDGKMALGRLGLVLSRHPLLLSELLNMGINFRKALKSLKAYWSAGK
jgi:adenosylhomocysteine nucleosidase